MLENWRSITTVAVIASAFRNSLGAIVETKELVHRYILVFLAGVVIGAIGAMKLMPVPQVKVSVEETSASRDRRQSFNVRGETEADATNAPFVFSDHYSLMEQLHALKATVRITTASTTGSGTLVGWHPGLHAAVIVTAHHVVQDESIISVEQYPFSSHVTAHRAGACKECDLALLTITAYEPPACLPIWAGDNCNFPSLPVMSVGCSRGHTPTIEMMKIMAGVYAFPHCNWAYLITDNQGAKGRSGGPLVYRGYLIGVCYGVHNAREPIGGMYTYHQPIHHLVKEAGMQWLLHPTAVPRVAYRYVGGQMS